LATLLGYFPALGILGSFISGLPFGALVTFTLIPVIFICARLVQPKSQDAFRDLRRGSPVEWLPSGSLSGLALGSDPGSEKKFDDFNKPPGLSGRHETGSGFALFMPLMEDLAWPLPF
jgi:hypothetical protein